MGIAYHRHCQATILGASGYLGGEDDIEHNSTWGKISGLVPILRNLPDNWLNEFKYNGNVTDDLEDMLKLINDITVSGGDLTDIINGAIRVKNTIPDDHSGFIGIS